MKQFLLMRLKQWLGQGGMEQRTKVYRHSFTGTAAQAYQEDAVLMAMEGWRVQGLASAQGLLGPELVATYQRDERLVMAS